MPKARFKVGDVVQYVGDFYVSVSRIKGTIHRITHARGSFPAHYHVLFGNHKYLVCYLKEIKHVPAKAAAKQGRV